MDHNNNYLENNNLQFTFTGKQKTVFLAMIGVGILSLVYGIATQGFYEVWGNVLLNNVFFLGASIIGIFFIAVNKVGESAWQVSFQRVNEACMSFIPIAGILMLVFFIGGNMIGHHSFYHWIHPEGDPILEGKSGYLNIPFFLIRMVVYFAGWTLFSMAFRKTSLAMDADNDLKYWKKMQVICGAFIAFFAVTSSTSAWDWIMSIDAHWFSTLFGWYMFASMFVTGLAVMILLILYLNKQGYMTHINNEHLHDLGKFLFGFSIFWTYLWFSQFMLIWYSNIPEETVYFVQRIEDYRVLFFSTVVINFVFPLLALMMRDAKRQRTVLAIVSIVVIIGHWLDFFVMIMPGALGRDAVASIDILEIGLTIGYTGLFLFFVFRALTKADLLPKNHPFLKEAFDYDNIGA